MLNALRGLTGNISQALGNPFGSASRSTSFNTPSQTTRQPASSSPRGFTLDNWALSSGLVRANDGRHYVTPESLNDFYRREAEKRLSSLYGPAPQQLSAPVGSSGGGVAGYNLPQYQAPKVPQLSEKELTEMSQRYANLQVDPQIESLRRMIGEAQAASEREREMVQSAYDRGLKDLDKTTKEHQRAGSVTMARRNIYDSGMATDLANRIDRTSEQIQGQQTDEYNRAIEAIARELALVEKHNREQEQALEARRGEMAQALLADLMRDERSRADMLSQRDFDNWATRQQLAMQAAPRAYGGSSGGAVGTALEEGVPDFEGLVRAAAWQQLFGGRNPESLSPAHQYAIGYYDPYRQPVNMPGSIPGQTYYGGNVNLGAALGR